MDSERDPQGPSEVPRHSEQPPGSTAAAGNQPRPGADEIAQARAVLRIAAAIDDHLYTNEHLPDGSRRSLYAGPNRDKLMGGPTPPGADTAVDWEQMIHPDDWEEHLKHRARLRLGQPSDVRYRLRGYDGVTRWIHARTRPARVDGRLFVDGIVSNVTRQVEAELELAKARAELERLAAANEHQALHDALTGLGNRRKLMRALETAVEGGEAWILALFDLDGFKGYNDTFGHPAGDALLVRLASSLRDAMPPDATYRFGGDEFLVLARVDADTDLETLLARATAALTETGEGFSIAASFGGVLIPGEAASAEDAVRLCDQRLYNEKHNRRERRGRPQDVLLEALHARQGTLEVHSEAVASLAVEVAKALALSPTAIDTVKQAALLHDIGKIGIPDSLLEKPGPLSDNEWELMRRHTLIGERILAASPALAPIAPIIRSSHERIDGNGYPDGLAGHQISIESRIIAACDSFAAMTSPRTYRHPLTETEAIAELERACGTQLDPDVVAALTRIVTARSLQAAAPDAPA